LTRSTQAFRTLPMNGFERDVLEQVVVHIEKHHNDNDKDNVNVNVQDITLSSLLLRFLHATYRLRLLLLTKKFVDFHADNLFKDQLGLPRNLDNQDGTELCVFFWKNEIAQ
jgi:hypothetical protein